MTKYTENAYVYHGVVVPLYRAWRLSIATQNQIHSRRSRGSSATPESRKLGGPECRLLKCERTVSSPFS